MSFIQFQGETNNEKNQIPRTLRDARDQLLSSEMLKQAYGEEIINHYARAAEWELEEFDSVVTDYEIMRGFEKSWFFKLIGLIQLR